jgi:hypothetical protein
MKKTGCELRKKYMRKPEWSHMEDCAERIGDAPEVVKRRRMREDIEAEKVPPPVPCIGPAPKPYAEAKA